MKVTLPDGSAKVLDTSLNLDDKLKLTFELTEEWNSVIIENWNSKSVKYFLDSLSNFLVWHKEDDEKLKRTENKYILSRKKTEKLSRYKSTSKQINFSDLNKEDKEVIGINDENDVGEKTY